MEKEKKDTFQIGSRIALLVGQFIILALCFIYIQYIYSTNILPDKIAKETFQETECFIVSEKLEIEGRFIYFYRADFLISYNVNGVQYNRWVSGNGLDQSFSNDQYGQQSILSQYTVGGSYPCWYDPNDPQIAILVLRHHWLSIFPLVFPTVIALIVLYYLFKNIFRLVALTTTQSRDEGSEKKGKR